ncbi:uncharacterized protein LOC132201187 [Neocloeon triangulifer]|uniref:uncharacterized protein LOC132201187 n=1 Tax=Neocloeon triangulifer TaxID=2078957 RepID=UPI00286ED1A8|nr:uncharacterized protein LOC132201187 [Neocloeon triangulifer]
MSWAENVIQCCKLGMSPIYPERSRIDQIIRANIFYSSSLTRIESFYDLAPFFWTAGTRLGCAGHFRFCMHDLGPWDADEEIWNKINTAYSGACLSMGQYGMTTYFVIQIMPCTTSLVNFACERENTNVIDVIGRLRNSDITHDDAGNFCNNPICEPITCIIDLKRMDFVDIHWRLFKPQLLGYWQRSCNVYYLISKRKVVIINLNYKLFHKISLPEGHVERSH